MALSDEAKQIFQKAFDTLDYNGDRIAAWQAERQAETFDQRYEREAKEADAYLAALAARRGETEDKPEPTKPKQRRTAAAMDYTTALIEQEQRLRAFTMKMTEALAEEAGSTCGRLESEIIKLQRQLADLKSQVESLRAQNVTSMRSRHVA
jgi:hypothetical protein